MRVPLYQQIAEKLQHLIESGVLPPGAKLPTEPELTEEHKASRNTIRLAVRWLINRGLVQIRPGQGTFVVELIRPFITTLSADPDTGLGGGEGEAYKAEVRAQGRDPFAPPPRVEKRPAAAMIAEELQVTEDSPVVGRYQQRYIDGAPFSLQNSYYPMFLVAAGARSLLEASSIEPGAVHYLREALGFRQASYRDRITVRAPRPEEAEFFGLPDNSRVSVFETFRTAFDGQVRPFRLTLTIFPADRNQFVVFAGDVPDDARDQDPPAAAPGSAGAPSRPDSLYRRIAESLRLEIEAGRLGSGSQLPTEAELTRKWGASRSTVREAIKRLTELGLVEAWPGQGTFVTQQIDPIITDLSVSPDLGGGEEADYFIAVLKQHRKPRSTVPKVENQVAGGIVASELRLAAGSEVVSRHQQRFVDEQPYSLQTSFYAMDMVTRGAVRLRQATNVDQGCVRYLQEVLGIEQVGYRDLITVRAPNPTETSFFQLPADGRVAVFETFRTSYDQNGQPMRITVTVYPSDRNQFVINVAIPEAGQE
jgi:GntR family transcriptional regulator